MSHLCDVDAAGAGRDGGDDVVAAVFEVGAGKDGGHHLAAGPVPSTGAAPVYLGTGT